MKKQKYPAMTIIEVIIVITIIGILAGMTIWKTNEHKELAYNIQINQLLDYTQQLENLAEAENITVTNTDAKLRFKELQSRLTAKGHVILTANPEDISKNLMFSSGEWSTISTP